jgi:hypothetical protein
MPMPSHPSSLPELISKINHSNLDPLARNTGFLSRSSPKINPANFLLTACLFALQGYSSLSDFAHLWALLHRQTLSKQAVQKRFSLQAVNFLQAVLQKVLLTLLLPASVPCPLKGCFNRILLQDSTFLSLPSKLHSWFPGTTNQSERIQAGLKVQATVDLLKNQWLNFSLTPATNNDQGASPQILDILQKGDLIIRDLGYLVYDVFRKIDARGAFFLSRSRFGLSLFCPQSAQRFSLLSALRHHSGHIYEHCLHLGAHRLPVRLIAQRLPQAVADARRRKARACRDKRTNHSKEYMQLLGWNIFITNVPSSRLDATTLIELYSVRWRIETIFKSWKSHFKLADFTNASAQQILVVILAKLIWICWFSTHWSDLVSKGFKISLIKLARWWSRFAVPLALNAAPIQLHTLFSQLVYYCSYEKRRKRLNFLQFARSLG